MDDLRTKAREHAAELAALMVTYPSTHGVFEEEVKRVCAIVHEHGGTLSSSFTLPELAGLVAETAPCPTDEPIGAWLKRIAAGRGPARAPHPGARRCGTRGAGECGGAAMRLPGMLGHGLLAPDEVQASSILSADGQEVSVLLSGLRVALAADAGSAKDVRVAITLLDESGVRQTGASHLDRGRSRPFGGRSGYLLGQACG